MSNKELNILVFNAIIKAIMLSGKQSVNLTKIHETINLEQVQIEDVKSSIDMLIAVKYVSYNTFNDTSYYKPTKTGLSKWTI